MQKKPTTVSSYIAAAPTKARPMLRQLRQVIQRAVPEAREWMSYGIPAYEYRVHGYDGRLIYFAAYANHLSLYPATEGLSAAPTLRRYQVSVGTLRFPYDQPLPLVQIGKFIRARKRALDRRQRQRSPSARR